MLSQILPNIIFILAMLGVIIMVLRRLPEAAEQVEHERILNPSVEEKLWRKGLPAKAISKLQASLRLWIKKIWNFALEAKDLKPSAVAGYHIRKIFHAKPQTAQTAPQTASAMPATPKNAAPAPAAAEVAKDEQYYLTKIKAEPKNLGRYDDLGKFYMEKNDLGEAHDVYQYLVKHDPGNADYQAHVALINYKQHQYAQAAEHYQKSVSLDATQPNRYYNLGASLDALGRTEDAVKAFEQALALEQKNVRYYLTLSNAYVKLNNQQRAKMILRQARAIDPGNTEVENKLRQLS